jgi:hypothetical protein
MFGIITTKETKQELINDLTNLLELNSNKQRDLDLIVNMHLLSKRFLFEYRNSLLVDRAIASLRPCINIEDEI